LIQIFFNKKGLEKIENSLTDPQLKTLCEEIKMICDEVLAMQFIDMRRGKLQPLINQIQNFLSQEPFNSIITRFLLSLANINQIIQQFNLGGVCSNPGSPLVSKRPSISKENTSPLLDLSSSLRFSSETNLAHICGENEQFQQNIFIELSFDGKIQYISPTCLEILGYFILLFFFFLILLFFITK